MLGRPLPRKFRTAKLTPYSLYGAYGGSLMYSMYVAYGGSLIYSMYIAYAGSLMYSMYLYG